MDIIKRLSSLDENVRVLEIERALTLEKAFKSRDAETIFKAKQYYESLRRPMAAINNPLIDQLQRSQGPRKSIIIDPMDVQSSMGYYYKPGSLSYMALRAMARTPIIRAIIDTRKDQVAEYCKPQQDKYSPGFIFVKKGVDPDDLSDSDKKIIEKLNEFTMVCGDEENKWDCDDFETFVRKVVDDSLVLDQGCFEVIPNRSGEPTQFVAVDAATIRVADTINPTQNSRGSVQVNGRYPSYVQIWLNQVIAEFYPWELCFGVRNATTNIKNNGYGRGELEDLIGIVTSMLNADAYNGKFFRNGSAPRGALMVKGAGVSEPILDQFRADWAALMQGTQNAHRTPVLAAESFEWVNMHVNNRDMEFSKFQEYLIKVGCAVYKMSPEEVGFPLQGTGRSGLGRGDGGKEEKDYSKTKGLKPLLSRIQSWLNRFVYGPLTNYQFEFQFTGLDAETAKEEEERLLKATEKYMTPDEVRKLKKMKPLPDGVGKYPLSPIIQSILMGQQQSEMQQQNQMQGEQDEQAQNMNPFLDEDSPMTKAFNDWVEDNLLVKS